MCVGGGGLKYFILVSVSGIGSVIQTYHPWAGFCLFVCLFAACLLHRPVTEMLVRLGAWVYACFLVRSLSSLIWVLLVWVCFGPASFVVQSVSWLLVLVLFCYFPVAELFDFVDFRAYLRSRSLLKNRQALEQEGVAQSRPPIWDSSVINIFNTMPS